MRRFVPVCLVLWVVPGCFTSAGDHAGGVNDPDPNGAPAAECQVAADCTAAGPSCCACPTFAVARDPGWEDSCEDLCDAPPSDCSAVAACEQGTCTLACLEVSCDGALQCDGGPAVDAVGCLTCACGPGADPTSPMAECQVDDDCVQVAADCCGCAQGGADTAVPIAEAVGFTDSLGCTGGGSCPGVNVCDPADVVRCSAGRCVLTAAPADEEPDAGAGTPQLCGSTALPPCPDGYRCVLNAADAADATRIGLGVCRP